MKQMRRIVEMLHMEDNLSVTRRTFAGLGVAGLGACATTLQSRNPLRSTIVPVRISADRIVRVDVGLRPYRRSGFRVEREQLGDKTVVHNYGHGGGGITLSWGTSKLAVDLGFNPTEAEYAVIGAGVAGLTTARLLQERGVQVKIYAKELSPATTSNVAGGQWWPASVFEAEHASPAFRQQLVEASHFSFRRYQTLVGPQYGVSWETNYVVADEPIRTEPTTEDSPLRVFSINQQDLVRGEHPFAAPYVRRFETMMIETPHYLRALERDVRIAGGEIVVRSFASRSDLNALPERIVFNCTGLGAGALFDDRVIEPVRGQLVTLLPQPEVDYNIVTLGDVYMFGRWDGIVLGGTFQHGNWSLEPDPNDTAEILRGNGEIFRGIS